jgi:hypothetical protein
MTQNHNIVAAAENLLQEHFEQDPRLEKVIWINPEQTTEIRLLEITPDTFPAGAVLSFYFPPDEEFPYAMKIAEIRPEEWQQILRNEIPLPDGWTLENYKAYSREAITV